MRLRKLASVALVASVVSMGGTTAANAYSGSAAAGYADHNALQPNPGYYNFADDCTNFVSQSLLYGGKHTQGSPNPGVINDRTQWWVWGNASGRTFSWSVANELWLHLVYYDPGASGPMVQSPSFQGAYTPGSIKTGDPVVYDFTSNGSIDHAAIQVGIGTDPGSGWYGNIVDEHTTGRKHAIWHLTPYNSQWASTNTAEIHVSS